MRRVAVLFLLAFAAAAANVKLYLKDGGYHVVREYQVQEDRVRFYSIERSEWEEMPLELVDLKRTEAEIKSRREAISEEAKVIAEEDAAEREARRQASQVPYEPGAYWINGKDVAPLKQAESKVSSNKRRSVLQRVVPIPVLAGKATVELDGEKSAFVVNTDKPEFYFRLHTEERFGIIKLKPEKGVRIVQRWSIVPVTREIIEEHETVEVFRQQVHEGLYKIWPEKPLEPGEYAVMEYTEGKANIQVWDFAYRPAPKAK
jgi:hypothetical protein